MKPSSSRAAGFPARGAALLAAAALAAAPAPAADYTLDPQASFVHFEVLHFDTSTIRGRFGPVEGHVSIDPAAGRGEVGLRIPTAQVDTGVAVFDSRLREPDLLASTEFPEAWFVARRFRFEQGGLAEVRGEFTLRGVGQPLSLHALRWSCRHDEAAGRERCGGDFEAEFRRSDHGMTFGLPFIADRVRLQVQVEGLRTR